MARVFAWMAVLVGIAGLIWYLFMDPEPEPPAYGPLADVEDGEEAPASGPALVGREGGTTLESVEVGRGGAFIHGIVVDKDGAPVSGARVTAAAHAKWHRATSVNQRIAALALFEPMRGVQRRVTAYATTKPDGAFRITGLEKDRSYSVRSAEDGSWRVKGLKQGDYEVMLTPGGDWMLPAPIAVRAGDEGIEIKLKKGLTIEGHVLKPEGAPLPGANVWLAETQSSKTSRGTAKQAQDWMASMRLRTTTGADGRFVIKGLPDDAFFNVSAGGAGADQPFITDMLKDVAAGTKTVELKLRKGALIEGEIIAPDGGTVGNGWIHATPVDPKAGLNSANVHLSSSSNTFKLGPLAPGRYRLQLHSGGHAAPAPMEVDAPSTGIRIELGKMMSIAGTLMGDDVKGFHVQYGAKGQFQSSVVKADGTWRIANAKHATGTLFAFRKGDERYAQLENVTADQGPHSLSLQFGETISGSIDGYTGEGRKPNIYCMTNGRWVQGSVEKDGTFRITGLPPGRYNVQGWVQGGSIPVVPEVEAGTKGLTLTMTRNKK